MSLFDLVDSFMARRVGLWTDGDRLVFDAPDGELTEADVELLRSRKAELVAFLQSPPTPEDAAKIDAKLARLWGPTSIRPEVAPCGPGTR